MDEIDDFVAAVCGTNPLDAFGAIYAASRKISLEPKDGYNYDAYFDHYVEGDVLFRARLKDRISKAPT
jgi:hypothetical protein